MLLNTQQLLHNSKICIRLNIQYPFKQFVLISITGETYIKGILNFNFLKSIKNTYPTHCPSISLN